MQRRPFTRQEVRRDRLGQQRMTEPVRRRLCVDREQSCLDGPPERREEFCRRATGHDVDEFEGCRPAECSK